MNIPAINSINNNSFKGLWGKTVQHNDYNYSEQYDIRDDSRTREYYPFKDETQETINEVVKRNKTYKQEMVDYTNPPHKSVLESTGTDIKVMSKLEFTAYEWAKYVGNSLKSALKVNHIENNLKKLHLEKHLRP